MKVSFKNILCTTDLSDHSNTAITYGVALAKEFNAKLFICHIVDLTATVAYGEVMFAPIEIQEKTVAFAREQIERNMRAASFEWETLISVGHPADEIATSGQRTRHRPGRFSHPGADWTEAGHSGVGNRSAYAVA